MESAALYHEADDEDQIFELSLVSAPLFLSKQSKMFLPVTLVSSKLT